MNVQLNKQELHKLKRMHSDYKTYQDGKASFFLNGLCMTLIGITFVWATLIVIGAFKLDTLIVSLAIILLLFLVTASLLWKYSIEKNARKLEEKIKELKVSIDELEFHLQSEQLAHGMKKYVQ